MHGSHREALLDPESSPQSMLCALFAPLFSWVPQARLLFIVNRHQGKVGEATCLRPERLPPRGARKNKVPRTSSGLREEGQATKDWGM